MSLNTAHTDGGVVIHQGEMILLHAPSTLLSFSGSDELKSFGEQTGNSYLTTHRLIFLNKGNKSQLKSFSLPFCVLTEVDVEQPVFGANYLKGKVRAQPNGNWRGEAKWKLQFKAGGAIDFAQGMLKAIHIARQTTAQNQYWNEPPPAYAAATFMPAPPAYYAPPPSYYGWSYGNGYQFPPPEAGTVYVYEAPPPYPGIGGGGALPAYGASPYNAPPQQQQGFGYAPPQQPGYAPPQQPGYAPPQQPGYQPQQSGYTSPQQGYAAPQQGFGYPTQPGYAPPQQGFGYGPQQSGYAPPQQGFGYAPQQPGGVPPQGGYASQPGYAPPQYTSQYQQAGPMNGNAMNGSAPPYSEHNKKQN